MLKKYQWIRHTFMKKKCFIWSKKRCNLVRMVKVDHHFLYPSVFMSYCMFKKSWQFLYREYTIKNYKTSWTNSSCPKAKNSILMAGTFFVTKLFYDIKYPSFKTWNYVKIIFHLLQKNMLVKYFFLKRISQHRCLLEAWILQKTFWVAFSFE